MNNTIILGPPSSPIAEFSGAAVEGVSGFSAVDIVSDRLSIDTLDPAIRFVFIVPKAYKPSDYDGILTTDGKVYCCHYEGFDLASRAPWGTPLRWLRGGTLRGLYYVESVEQVTADLWRIKAMSLVGVLAKQKHSGRVYTGQEWATVLQEIIGGSLQGTVTENGTAYRIYAGGLEDYMVESGLATVKVYGWLPFDWKRSNLHQLLLSAGASMTRNDSAKLTFRYISSAEAADIEPSRIFLQSGGIRMDSAATGIQVSEHIYQYAYNSAPVSLFDNTNAYAEPADYETVIFSGPVKPDSMSVEGGLAVHQIDDNYAVVSGKGILKAVPYIHLTRVLSRHSSASSPENVISFNSCTLISAMNSENALERLFNFYTAAKEAQAEISVRGERPGHAYEFKNSVGRKSRGVLSSMDFASGVNLKARSGFVSNYTPGPFGNNYNNSALLTGSGTWTVPASVRTSDFPFIRITLVGAGGGGQGGEGGKQGRGTWTEWQSDGYGDVVYNGHGGGQGGKGGKGGAPGTPGKVWTIAKLDVTDIAYISYSCGSGGTGGNAGIGGLTDNTDPVDPGLGAAGGETVLRLYNDSGTLVATYSTASGSILPSGVANLVSNEVYGLSGIPGTAGGQGGEGGASAFGSWGADGESVVFNGVEYPGGKGSASLYAQVDGTSMIAQCGGGGGGGAAVGAAGGDAPTEGRASYMQAAWGGDGGMGATPPIIPAAPVAYGQSGDGGHAGGGGGSGGAQNWHSQGGGFNSGIHDGLIGAGGNGVNGADGADGCWFVYY